MSKTVELLELPIFDRAVIGGVKTVIMIELHRFSFEVGCGRRFVDAADIPALRLGRKDSFEFRVVIKRHGFYSTIPIMKEKVFERLAKAGLPYRVIEHAAVHHVGEEPPELARLPSTKCLLLTDPKTGSVYLVAMRGEERLDLKKLSALLGTGRLKFVQFDDVERVISVPPGSVSVFAVCGGTKNIEIVFDTALLGQIEIGFHPNVNTATVLMRPQDVIEFLRLQGCMPRVAEL